MTGTLADELRAAVADPARIRTRAIDLAAYANDASHYLFTPSAVVLPETVDEVAALLRAATATGSAVTLRSGGTSLSGQASGTGLLLDVRRHFGAIEVLDHGRRVRAGSGATVRHVNARLAPFGHRLGPDPASEIACTIGGIVANNSSGMACGTVENAYRTIESMVVVLPSGTVVRTGEPGADAMLQQAEPELVDTLLRLRDRVRGDASSVVTVRERFAMKNTMGYGVNAFLDFDDPAEILAHLMIGSEGTLGFVAEATFRTIPVRSEIATAVTVFPDLESATRALPALVETGAATLELMDATSLRVGRRLAGVPSEIEGFEVTTQASLLVEYHAGSADELRELVARGRAALSQQPLQSPVQLTRDAERRHAAWTLRKGLYASVAGARAPGTTALLEDVVVPVGRLADTCRSLQELFDRHGYRDSVIFGHAKDGNIHFMLTDCFTQDGAVRRYEEFTEQMVRLVLGNGGNLKAEHGTGRAMAPFVRRQYGDELYDVMVRLKRAVDPHGVMNPGVLIEDDPTAHVRGLKTPIAVEEEVDRCVECGYCEPVCPSRRLTLTPRQRIVVQRAYRGALAAGDEARAAEIERDYDYAVVQTCAVDGMCKTACPVGINTGDLVRRLREQDAPAALRTGWDVAARGWSTMTQTAAVALSAIDRLPTALISGPNRVARAIAGADVVPLYSPELPRGGRQRSSTPLARASRDGTTTEPVAVYVPSCQNAMFGPAHERSAGLQSSIEALLGAAGIAVVIPAAIDDLCCGTPWSSKGMMAGHSRMRERVVDVLRVASRDGELPLVVDASSCTEGFRKLLGEVRDPPFRILDAVEFVRDEVLPVLQLPDERLPSITLHPTCSSTQLGLNDALADVAGALADDVRVPDGWGCCGFAGDRGMLHPELTASATAAEATAARALGSAVHASCNRACELGLTRAVGAPYRGILEILAERAGLVEA